MCDLVILVCYCIYLYGQHKPTVAAAGTESPKPNDFCQRVSGILLKFEMNTCSLTCLLDHFTDISAFLAVREFKPSAPVSEGLDIFIQ